MKIIDDKSIRNLGIKPVDCIDWVKNAFIRKPECQLPAKISVHPQGIDFFTSMPCLLPRELNRFCIKVVSRINGRTPSLRSDAILFDATTGEMLALVDTDWITTMRTGAVAALAMQTFKKSDARTYAFIGLGNTARATMICLLASKRPEEQISVRLLAYKDQAEKFAEQFGTSENVSFEIVDNVKDLIRPADVIVSCVTESRELFCDDLTAYKQGVLIVPVHTRGFQNCDPVFDKIFCDDVAHVSGFRHFNEFRQLAEIGEVLRGEKEGRTSDDERIISYNIGLALHDAYFCSKIYDQLANVQLPEIELQHNKDKYII